MKQPYIGVTGFMSTCEVRQVLKTIPDGVQRKIMVGVLASSKTIQGIPNSWPNRYPRPERIAGIFPNHPLALNLIHFNTKDPGQLLNQMLAATQLGGKNFHGFQLNIKWPEPYILKEYRRQHPDKVLVLQCGNAALEAIDHDPARLVKAVLAYEEICEYLLIDPSGGLGKPFDPQKGYEYLQYLNAIVKGMAFGIAGGLSAETLGLLMSPMMSPIAKVFPNTSIDAEGKLRNKGDHLDITKARRFISKAFELFSYCEK